MSKNIEVNFNNYKSQFPSLLHSYLNFHISSSIPTENRLRNLEHIRERLDELEQLVTYYHADLLNQPDEEPTAYEIEKTPLQQTANHENTPKYLDKLSDELTAKRL